MAGVDLDRFFLFESEVGIEIDIVIEDVLGHAKSAKGDEIGNALLEFVDLSFFDPRGKLFVDRSGPFLEDEGGVVQVQGVDDVQGIVKSDGGVGMSRMEMDVQKSGFVAEMVKSDLVALEVSVFFPSDFINSCLPEGFKSVDQGNLRGPKRRSMVDVLEKLQDVFAVFGDESKALIAVVEVVKGLI